MGCPEVVAWQRQLATLPEHHMLLTHHTQALHTQACAF